MSAPAKPFNAIPLKKAISRQAWVVFGLVLLSIALDFLLKQPALVMSKNILVGALLAWLGQLLFANIALGLSGYRYRRQIVHRFYLAHLLKWLFTLIGFGLIFLYFRPLAALWVFVGFILLQISYMVLLARYKNQKVTGIN